MRLVDEDEKRKILFYRITLLDHVMKSSEAGNLVLPGKEQGKPSDAIFRAFAEVPMKFLSPNVEHHSLPFDMEELIQRSIKRRLECSPGACRLASHEMAGALSFCRPRDSACPVHY
jgi:hypothetical protein